MSTIIIKKVGVKKVCNRDQPFTTHVWSINFNRPTKYVDGKGLDAPYDTDTPPLHWFPIQDGAIQIDNVSPAVPVTVWAVVDYFDNNVLPVLAPSNYGILESAPGPNKSYTLKHLIKAQGLDKCIDFVIDYDVLA